MRRLFCLFVGTIALLALPGFSVHADAKLTARASSSNTGDRSDVLLPDGKKDVAHLIKKLQLTHDQELCVRAILADRDHQIGLIDGSGVLSGDAKAARTSEVLAGSNELIAETLRAPQREKFDEILSRQRHHKQKLHDGEADLLPGASPSSGQETASRLSACKWLFNMLADVPRNLRI